MRKNLILSSLLVLTFLTGRTEKPLEENINVEGTYIPDFIAPDKFNILPQPLDITIPVPEVSYDLNTAVADFRPTLFSLPAWRERPRPAFPRYVSLTMGSRLDAGLQAGYRFIRDKRTNLSAHLGHLSTSLFRTTLPDRERSRRRFSYDESLGLDFSRDFGKFGTVSASAEYRLRYINYYTLAEAPTQTVNDVSVSAGWTASGQNTWRPRAGIGFRHFAYRDFPFPSFAPESQTMENTTAVIGVPGRESSVCVEGGFSHHAGPGVIDVEADINTIFLNTKGLDYGLLRINPSYSFRTLGIDIRAGFRIAATVNAGLKGDRFPAVTIAPDVRFSASRNGVSGWLEIEGGTRLQTLASESALMDWGLPGVLNTSPLHSPLSTSLGMSVIPRDGLEFRIQADYRILKHLQLKGFYPLMLTFDGEEAVNLMSLNTKTSRIHGVRIKADIRWNPNRWFDGKLNAAWQPQDGTTGWDDGIDRPEWVFGAEASTNPYRSLKIGVSYAYRGTRGLWLRDDYGKLTRFRMPDVSLLGASASYTFRDRLTVGIDAVNLLNRHTPTQPGLPEEGFTLLGRAQLLF